MMYKPGQEENVDLDIDIEEQSSFIINPHEKTDIGPSLAEEDSFRSRLTLPRFLTLRSQGKHRGGKETQRDIIANNQQYNNRFNYANNFIKTSKYTLLTFLPLNLFEQFQRAANFYFACLLILQLIPEITSLTPITTALPLFGVLTLTAIKYAYDDVDRHRTDRQVNNRRSKVLRRGYLVEEKWHRVQVGDVIRMENNSFVAADILLLSSFNPNGLVYIETAELDGETNLKVKQCLDVTNVLGEDEKSLSQFNGHIICEAPNNNLSKFEGTLTYNSQKFSLDNEKVIYRGAVLRNTPWCYGVVLFAGKDTKLMQNSGKTKLKRTSIDKLLNFIILGIVIFLLCMCLFCTVAAGIWETMIGFYYQMFLPWDTAVPARDDPVAGATVIALLVFFSYAIVLNTVVPISLYVSVEVIRLFLSKLIDWDKEMYDIKSDTHAKARTTTLNEELGQIQYVFSDKTGTLTQNIMTFNKASIGGRSYGDILDENTGEPIDLDEHSKKVDFSANHYYEPTFEFYDQNLLTEVRSGNPDCETFFKLLSLCHTVMPQYSEDGALEYQAQSPDENALVSAARNFGFVFTERSPRTITIHAKGQVETHELLCILDFNNVRKRMSVIVKYEGKIRLYSKGADNVIFERLAEGQEAAKSKTQEHLDKFAMDGLRTLVLGVRELSQEQFDGWKAEHHQAAIAIENRDEKLDAVYNMIEKDLTLIGATAIEDKLQDGVPQTIANLQLAGIKVWVLTGDKQETAVNIGYSANLLNDDMWDEPYIVDGHTSEEVLKQLVAHRRSIDTHMSQNRNLDALSMRTLSAASVAETEPEVAGGFALVINGHSLVHALTPDMELAFLGVAEHCTAVICCRVTPLQKALVVELIKKYKEAVSLAIGDGANDVSMIKAADIGVGISGQEGMQAVLASDYSIAQFRYLERLLLVHGRWSYYRMCKFLRYFFYKNFAFTLCHFWYAFFCGFSAQTLLNEEFIAVYNLFYTSQPVLALACFDQDVRSIYATKFPNLYTPGHKSMFFNYGQFSISAVQGFVTSMVLFMIPMGAYHDKTDERGLVLADHYLFGSVVATILVIVVTAQIALDTSYWTVFNHITIWGSLIFYFCLTFAYNWAFRGPHVGSLSTAMSDTTFWFTSLLTTVVLLLPVVAWRFYKVDVHPTLTDKAKLVQRSARTRHKGDTGLPRPFSGRRSRRSVRSGYAFAHSEGFGRLITSGRIMTTDTTGTTGGRTKNGAGPRLNNNSNGGHKQSSSSFLSRLSGGSSKTPSPPHAKDNQVVPAPSGEMTPNYPGVPLSD